MMIVYLFIGYIIGASITGWISIKLDERKKLRRIRRMTIEKIMKRTE
jgi:hypothetical protein